MNYRLHYIFLFAFLYCLRVSPVFSQSDFPLLESVIKTRIPKLEFVTNEKYEDSIDNFHGEGKQYELEKIIGSRGNEAGEFLLPLKVNLNQGFIYVVDFGNQRVQTFTAVGEFQKVLEFEGLKMPVDIKFLENDLFVLDFELARLFQFKNGTGEPIVLAKRGARSGFLNAPDEIAIDPKNLIWVSDQNNNRIEVFTLEKMFSRTNHYFMNVGEFEQNTYLKAPKGVTYDPFRKSILVIDSGRARILSFDLDGNYRGEIELRSQAGGVVVLPQALFVDLVGNLYVSDHISHSVLKFDKTGLSKGSIGKPGTFPDIYAANTELESAPSSPQTSYFLRADSTLSFPQGIFVDESGDLFVCDWGNNRLKMFSMSFFRKGMRYYQEHRFRLAIDYFKRCDTKNPRYHLVEFYLAMCHYYLGELERSFASKIGWYKLTRNYLESLKLKSEIGKFENRELRDLALYYLSRVESYHME